jgi:hypothetical protein
MPELPAPCLVNVRLVKVPDGAPPYDCQVHGARCPEGASQAGTGPAGTAGAGPAGTAGAGAAPAELTPAGGGAAAVTEQAPAAGGTAAVAGLTPAGRAPAAAPDPTAARPRQLALVIVEVLAGARPDRQLVPLATDRVRARVRGLAPLLASGRRPRVVRILTSRPAVRVVEMTVVADFGPRSRALAMRFEHAAARPAAPGWPARPARWLCTAIEAG